MLYMVALLNAGAGQGTPVEQLMSVATLPSEASGSIMHSSVKLKQGDVNQFYISLSLSFAIFFLSGIEY